MSIEELNALKPSFDNPVELECDDGRYTDNYLKIKVVGIYRDRLVCIDGCGNLDIKHVSGLRHYPSKKQEPKIEILHEVFNDFGQRLLINEDGYYPIFSQKRFNSFANCEYLTRKTGVTRKLNLDTFELVEG